LAPGGAGVSAAEGGGSVDSVRMDAVDSVWTVIA